MESAEVAAAKAVERPHLAPADWTRERLVESGRWAALRDRLLAPPRACDALDLRPDRDDPSFRQSRIDWSDPAAVRSAGFDGVPGVETVVRVGELLYVPSYWFHYIVSLNQSAQCNTRSGPPPDHRGGHDRRPRLAHVRPLVLRVRRG